MIVLSKINLVALQTKKSWQIMHHTMIASKGNKLYKPKQQREIFSKYETF